MSRLFDPVRLGAIELPNRMLMAPVTRGRATRDHVPTPLMAEYYAQRASAGLIISEATGVAPEGLGWPFAPGIWSPAQVEGWKPVTDAVHAAGGRIMLQLWHMGRLAHPSFWGGSQPVSASASRAPGDAHTYDGRQAYVEARPLQLGEIRQVVEQFVSAARNAISAGFDGVQVHAANGYLIDQFLRDSSNRRTDDYGGSIPNRMRLLLELVTALSQEVGADRVAVRLSPNGEVQGVDDSDQEALFTATARALSDSGLAFLELRDVGPHGTYGASDRLPVFPLIRRVYRGSLVLNSDYSQAVAEYMIASGHADAVSFARLFIANPDLPQRFAHGYPLADAGDMRSWYGPGVRGYTDFEPYEPDTP
jgi:N-ethylmaleimide reductase